MSELLPCPVCGSYTISEYCNYEICPVCGWEDDPVQFDKPDLEGGANLCSLNQSKELWRKRSVENLK